MKKSAALVGVIVAVLGVFIRLFAPNMDFGLRLGGFGVTLRFIGDVVGAIGVMVLIYGLIA